MSPNLAKRLIRIIENGQFTSYEMHGLLLTYVPAVTPGGQHCLMATCLNEWPTPQDIELVASSLLLAHRRHTTDICYNVSKPIPKEIRDIYGYAIYWQQWPIDGFYAAPPATRKQIETAMAM
jgi:hypothetical protein